MEQCRSLAFGWKHSKDYTCRAATETRRTSDTGDPRSSRVAARGGGCATGACRHRANHRGPRFHAGESKGRPHLTRCIHQRERLLLSEQRGPSLCAQGSFISCHPLQARCRLLDLRHPLPRPSVPRRLVLHARSSASTSAGNNSFLCIANSINARDTLTPAFVVAPH